MSTMYITEYANISGDNNGNHVQAGVHDARHSTQKVTFTTTAGQSAAFASTTHFIRVSCDAAAFLSFGEDPTAATTEGTPVQANTPEFFGVVPGQKVSAVA